MTQIKNSNNYKINYKLHKKIAKIILILRLYIFEIKSFFIKYFIKILLGAFNVVKKDKKM